MKPPRQPLFVPPGTYRRRRLMDAARMLPALAAVLMLLPLLWGDPQGAGRSTSTDGLYLFVLWAGLILAARLLAGRLQDAPPEPPQAGGPEG